MHKYRSNLKTPYQKLPWYKRWALWWWWKPRVLWRFGMELRRPIYDHDTGEEVEKTGIKLAWRLAHAHADGGMDNFYDWEDIKRELFRKDSKP